MQHLSVVTRIHLKFEFPKKNYKFWQVSKVNKFYKVLYNIEFGVTPLFPRDAWRLFVFYNKLKCRTTLVRHPYVNRTTLLRSPQSDPRTTT